MKQKYVDTQVTWRNNTDVKLSFFIIIFFSKGVGGLCFAYYRCSLEVAMETNCWLFLRGAHHTNNTSEHMIAYLKAMMTFAKDSNRCITDRQNHIHLAWRHSKGLGQAIINLILKLSWKPPKQTVFFCYSTTVSPDNYVLIFKIGPIFNYFRNIINLV